MEVIELAQLRDLPDLAPEKDFYYLSTRETFEAALVNIPKRFEPSKCFHFMRGKKGNLWYFEVKKPTE